MNKPDRTWDELTHTERRAVKNRAARCLKLGYTPEELRKSTDPLFRLAADEMDAETAARSARAGFRVLNGDRRLPPLVAGSADLSVCPPRESRY